MIKDVILYDTYHINSAFSIVFRVIFQSMTERIKQQLDAE